MRLPEWMRRITVLATIGGVSFTILLMASLYIVHFRFSQETNDLNRDEVMRLVQSSLQSSLELPLSTGANENAIQVMIDELVGLDSIYGIEVRDAEGRVLSSRVDTEDGVSVPVTTRTFSVISKLEGLELDFGSDEGRILGTVSVSFSALTSTERLDSALYMHGAILGGMVLLLAVALSFYIRTQDRFLKRVGESLSRMGRGERIVWEREYIRDFDQVMKTMDELSETFLRGQKDRDVIERSQSRALDQITGAQEELQDMAYRIKTAIASNDQAIQKAFFEQCLVKATTLSNKFQSIKRFRQVVESRIQEGVSSIYVEGFLHRACNDILSRGSRSRNIRISCPDEIVYSGLLGTVTTRQESLRMALVELIENALRFDEKGSIDVVWAIKQIGNTDHLEIIICDEGPGFQEGTDESLFEAFVSRGTKAGFGVGLAIVRHVISGLGGKTTLIEGRKGGCVSISVPVEAERIRHITQIDIGRVMIMDCNIYHALNIREHVGGLIVDCPKDIGLCNIDCDVLFIDAGFPWETIVELMLEARNRNPFISLVLMTCGTTDLLIDDMSHENIEGYVVSKPIGTEQLIEIYRKIRTAKDAVSEAIGRMKGG